MATLAVTARKVDWAQSLWHYARDTKNLSTEDQQSIARAFKPVARVFAKLPVMKIDPINPTVYRFYDLSLTDRISLLLRWASLCDAGEFMACALRIAEKPLGGFSRGTGSRWSA